MNVAVADVLVVPVELEVDALAQPRDAHHHEQLAKEDLLRRSLGLLLLIWDKLTKTFTLLFTTMYISSEVICI